MSQELFFQPLGRIKYVRALFTEQGPKRTALGILQVVQWLDPWVKLLGIFVGFCCWWKAEDKSPSDLGPSLWLSHRRFHKPPASPPRSFTLTQREDHNTASWAKMSWPCLSHHHPISKREFGVRTFRLASIYACSISPNFELWTHSKIQKRYRKKHGGVSPGGSVAKTLASKAAGWGGMAVQSLVIKLNSHMPRSQKAKTS